MVTKKLISNIDFNYHISQRNEKFYLFIQFSQIGSVKSQSLAVLEFQRALFFSSKTNFFFIVLWLCVDFAAFHCISAIKARDFKT